MGSSDIVDEKCHLRPGAIPRHLGQESIDALAPAVSRTGDWSQVAHYTQIVWPATQRVGCATASNRSNDYLVCRYLPAGNVVGVVMR